MPAMKVPSTVEHLDLNVVAKLLVKNCCNISKTAKELRIPIMDLRRLTLINPTLIDAAFEVAEKRLDKAEEILDEALNGDSPSARAAAAFFVLKNMERSRQRGWIPAASAANAGANVGVNVNIKAPPREVVFRWRNEDDDRRDAEAAEAERLREEGKLIEHEAGPEPSSKD